MGRLLKSYFFWTYPRGSFHYDIMVTLILAFIFVTPHLWNYGDKRTSGAHIPSMLSVESDGGNGFVFEVKNDDVQAVGEGLQLRTALRRVIKPVVGDAIYIDRYEPETDASGKRIGYKVWAHR